MPPGGHYIGRNDTTRLPRRHVILDTEAVAHTAPGGEIQSWRCGVAAFAELNSDNQWNVTTMDYTDPGELWSHISAFAKTKSRMVLWAHNLGYDLRIARALKHLHGLSWDLGDIRLARQGTWARWRKQGRTIAAVDSFGVWPVPLAVLGATFGKAKPGLPAGDDLADWFIRCRADVDILTSAVLSYLDWLRSADMGSWQMTGAGQSYTAFRHRWLNHRILVADDMDAREAERRAMWTGRAEAWRWGEDERQTVYDWDWHCSYARIARDVQLPTRQVGVRTDITLEEALRLAKTAAVLAEVEVETDVPVIPAEKDERILWPVGSFQTTLWDPELRLLAECGARVRVHRCWLYRKAPVLHDWALWILDRLAAPDEEVPAWLKLVLKHWSRALIGRFAMQYSTWEPYATSDVDTLALWSGHDMDSGESFQLMQVGTEVRELSGTQDGRDAVPAITGYVMSEARRRLWTATQLIDPAEVLYLDTDSLLLTPRGHRQMSALTGDPRIDGLRLKRRFRGWQIAGPRKVVLGGVPRIAGVPKRAARKGPWRFEGEVWRGLGESIARGESDTVRITTRTFRVLMQDTRRRHLPGGATAPFRMTAGTSGEPAGAG